MPPKRAALGDPKGRRPKNPGLGGLNPPVKLPNLGDFGKPRPPKKPKSKRQTIVDALKA